MSKTPIKQISSSILEEAIKVTTNRQGYYDAPEDNFKRTADLWNAYINNKPIKKDLDASDVAIMMILVKISRLVFQYKEDSAIDVAGYAQCLAQVEIAKKNAKTK